MMQPHEDRVVAELKELTEKLVKLRQFITSSSIFRELPADEQARLKTQEFHMSMTLPERMKRLAVDERGYPVPWFVAWQDGKPEFRASCGAKFVAAIRQKLCWVCGERLGVNVCFVAGPMCGINRTSSEPPSHLECARWSAQNCPFLSNPRMVRREDEQLNNANLRENAAGLALTRNPGVAMLWITRQFEVFDDGSGKYLIQMGEPESVEWWAHGREATRAEVEASVESGLPNLEAIARQQRGGSEALAKCVARFQRFLPLADRQLTSSSQEATL